MKIPNWEELSCCSSWISEPNLLWLTRALDCNGQLQLVFRRSHHITRLARFTLKARACLFEYVVLWAVPRYVTVTWPTTGCKPHLFLSCIDVLSAAPSPSAHVSNQRAFNCRYIFICMYMYVSVGYPYWGYFKLGKNMRAAMIVPDAPGGAFFGTRGYLRFCATGGATCIICMTVQFFFIFSLFLLYTIAV